VLTWRGRQHHIGQLILEDDPHTVARRIGEAVCAVGAPAVIRSQAPDPVTIRQAVPA
jgi:hypothetical protein